MGLRVDQLSLGPMGTNCYVVRRELGSPEAAVVDPSGSATELRLTLARLGTRCTGILVTHGHWDHLLGVADLAEGAEAPVICPEGERALLESRSRLRACGRPVRRATTPEILVAGGESVEVAGSSSRCWRPPATRRRTWRTTRRAAFSRGTSSSRAGRAHRHPGSELGDAPRVDPLARRAFPPDTVVYPGPRPETTLGAELARNPFLAELRSERQQGAPPERRAARTTCSRPTARLAAARRELDGSRALRLPRGSYTPVFEDAALFMRTSGAGSDVVKKEMYSFGDRGDARSRCGRGTAPIVRAYLEHGLHREPQPREALHDRADLPLRRPRRAASASTGSSPSRRSARTTLPWTPR